MKIDTENSGFMPIEIDGNINYHIEDITIVTCDDDFNPSSSLKITGSSKSGKPTLGISIEDPVKPHYRYRYEPAAIVNLRAEDEDEPNCDLIIAHHKGSVFLKIIKY